MSKAAIISDIHSNYYAFSACFEDAISKGAECFVFLGDYITDFPDARKTLDLLYKITDQFPSAVIRGNRERYMLEHRKGNLPFAPGTKTGSWLFNYRQLNDSDLDYFESLPIYDKIELFGVKLEIAHSGKDNDRFYYDADSKSIDAVISQMTESYLLSGHSHRQYIYTARGKTVINPGSVGVPREAGSLAHYGLLDIEKGDVLYTPCRIEYDLRSAIKHHFESGFVDMARCWAIASLYDAITGKEYTVSLLESVSQKTGVAPLSVDDEAVWQESALELGMKFTEKEILELAKLK